jgi:CARDB
MQKKQLLFFAGLALAFLLTSSSALCAPKKFKINTSSTTSKVKNITGMPDLVVKNVKWSSTPKEGDIVGMSGSLNIIVWNRGTAPAGESKLKIDCKSLTSTNYPHPLAGMIDVQPLGAGKSMAYSWPSASSEKWFAGTYRMTFTADFHFNSVKESNENNNKKILTFTVLSKTDLIKKLKVKPVMKPQLNTDLEVVSISMSPESPVSGQKVSVTAVIRNSGKLKTPEVDSLVTFWNTKGGGSFYAMAPNVPPLFPTQTFELKTTAHIITLGESAGISVKIDRFNKYKEINEKNNEKLHYFKVQCKPELSPYDYTKPKPANMHGIAKLGEDFKLDIWVYNNSGCASKPAVLAISGISPGIVTYSIPVINGNSKFKIPVTLKWEKIGTKNCEIIVDYTDTNSESIENNNRMPLRVDVNDGWPETE